MFNEFIPASYVFKEMAEESVESSKWRIFVELNNLSCVCLSILLAGRKEVAYS